MGIEQQIETSIVGPLFASVRKDGHRDPSLPDVVLDNRRTRAYRRILDALTSRGGAAIPIEIRQRLKSMVEAWSNQAFDDAFQPVQEFEIQCAQEHDVMLAERSGDPREVLEVREQEYRHQVIERFGSIELRGIQLNHRVILDLDRVYVPLHAEDYVDDPETPTKNSPNRIVLSKPRRRPIADIVKENSRIFLIGAPGSGKSTLISFLASRCAASGHGLSWPKRALPFVITVRELKEATIGHQWLAELLGIPSDLVMAALAEDRAVLLVDGLDEAPEPLRHQLTNALIEFARRYPKLPVVVTSRPSRPSGGPGSIQGCLQGFQGFRLADFANDDVNSFIDKWCEAAEQSACSSSPGAQKQAHEKARVAAADLKARLVQSRPVQRIAVNPLLTTILCVVHRFLGRTIPEHRVTLYEKCTDALLYEWDRAKFSKDAAVGDLDANQKRALLRGVASALHVKHEAEIPESEVVQHFAIMLPQLGKPQEDAPRIVYEIRDRSGLLVERSSGAFAFSHLTFQEYLTALDYASRSQELLSHATDPWWQEVISLAAGIPGCDAEAIIEYFLKRKEDRDAVLMAAKCLETAICVPLELRKKVEMAIEAFLPPVGWLQVERLLEIGLTVAPILARDLSIYNGEGKAWAIEFFEYFAYEPVIPLLIQIASDNTRSPLWLEQEGSPPYQLRTGEQAISALCGMARISDRARVALISVLSKVTLANRFRDWLKPGELLGDDFKPPRRGRSASRRAENTASGHPSRPSPE